MADATTIALGKRTFQPFPPVSIATRWDLYAAVSVNRHRAWASALALCYPRLLRHVPYRYDVLEHGGRVVDFLRGEEGGSVPWPEIIAGGVACMALCAVGLIVEPEVRAAEDFTEAEEE